MVKKRQVSKKIKFDKNVAIERIRLIRDAYSQLRSSQNTVVSGNIVSVVPVFALQALYSLGWGESTSLDSLKSHKAARISPDTAIIEINLKLCPFGKEVELEIQSKWIQKGLSVKMVNVCNGTSMKPYGFRFTSEREKFENATFALKELVRNCIVMLIKQN